ncbi:MAG: RNA methyltransferase [Bacteroidales bacterium]|nr:RNA methyltransferase [Bacteroidales bacterium]
MMTIENKTLRREVSNYLKLFVTENRQQRLSEIIANRTRHVTVVLEDLFQAQNISAVLRTCDCYGVQDVYVIQHRNEFEANKEISMGADKWLTIHEFPHSEHNVKECIDRLHEQGYWVAATLPDEQKRTIFDLPVEQKTAFLFGTELTGLSEEAVKYADGNVLIPMYGFTESFNISNSAAIILSHFTEKMRHSSVKWQLSDEEKEELFFNWLQKSAKDPDGLIDYFMKHLR